MGTGGHRWVALVAQVGGHRCVALLGTGRWHFWAQVCGTAGWHRWVHCWAQEGALLCIGRLACAAPCAGIHIRCLQSIVG
ncbi:unnamed protein product, partial [Staurois parvus]